MALVSKVICIICQDQLDSDNRRAIAIECGHLFHQDCVARWFRSRNAILGIGNLMLHNRLYGSCPICNTMTYLDESMRIFPSTDLIEDDDATAEINRLRQAADTAEEIKRDLQNEHQRMTNKLRQVKVSLARQKVRSNALLARAQELKRQVETGNERMYAERLNTHNTIRKLEVNLRAEIRRKALQQQKLIKLNKECDLKDSKIKRLQNLLNNEKSKLYKERYENRKKIKSVQNQAKEVGQTSKR